MAECPQHRGTECGFRFIGLAGRLQPTGGDQRVSRFVLRQDVHKMLFGTRRHLTLVFRSHLREQFGEGLQRGLAHCRASRSVPVPQGAREIADGRNAFQQPECGCRLRPDGVEARVFDEKVGEDGHGHHCAEGAADGQRGSAACQGPLASLKDVRQRSDDIRCALSIELGASQSP